MGRVYYARQKDLERDVAIKVIKATPSPDARERFRAEMRRMSHLSHSAIVPVYTGGTTEGLPYFVMRYVEGGTLYDVLKARKAAGLHFDLAEVAIYLEPIAQALDYLASLPTPVVHRDVKPANILVPDDPRPSATVLTDFGIALYEEDNRITSEGMRVGTDAYLAPELYPTSLSNKAPVATAASDRYALALIALEMLTLENLREHYNQQQWAHSRLIPEITAQDLGPRNQDFAEHINTVLHKALAENPARRYASAREFIEELTTPTATPRRECTARKWLSAAMILALCGIGVAGAWSYLAKDDWSGPQKEIAAEYPQIVGEKEGGTGWEGLKCDPQEVAAEAPMEASISCSSLRQQISVLEFASSDARSDFKKASPGRGSARKEGDRCRLEVVAYADDLTGFYPDGKHSNFVIFYRGELESAAEIPAC